MAYLGGSTVIHTGTPYVRTPKSPRQRRLDARRYAELERQEANKRFARRAHLQRIMKRHGLL